MAKPIGTLGTVDTINVGGRIFTDLTTALIMAVTQVGANTFGTFRKTQGTAGYQVTTGKTLTIHAVQLICNAGGNYTTGGLGYGDTDIGLNSAAAPTNPIYIGGSTGIQPFAASALASGGYQNVGQYPCNFTVPALKYPLWNGPQSQAMIFGYET